MVDKENIFKEFTYHLLNDEKPSIYFEKKLKEGLFDDEYPFSLLGKLAIVYQSKEHHPEGSVWNHTMLVIDKAAEVGNKSEDKEVFMWAALLHDIGKPSTTKLRKGKITTYNHDKVGEKLSKEFLEYFNCDDEFIYKVSKLVRWHMQTLFVVKNLPFKEIENMKKQASVKEIALLSLCDRLGRDNLSYDKIEGEKANIRLFLQKMEG